MMKFGLIDLKVENSMNAMIGGLVSVTASCYSADVWAASVIGFFAAYVCFGVEHIVRWKLGLDGELCFFVGILSC